MSNLDFLNRIIWIDSNKAIHTEASNLVWIFGGSVDIYDSVIDASEATRQQDSICLIVCSSRMIEEVYKTFWNTPTVYPKFVIFCGSRSRADEIKTKSPCSAAVEAAYWDLGDLIDGITKIDKKLNSNPGLMKSRVKLDLSKFQPQEQKMEMSPANKPNPGKQSPAESNYPIKKIQKQQEKQVYANPAQNQPKPPVPKKINENTRILWILNDGQQSPDTKYIKNNYIRVLEQSGYPIHAMDSAENLTYIVRDQYEFRYFLLSMVGVDLEDLKVQVNDLGLVIKVGKANGEDANHDDENQKIAETVQEIVKFLEQLVEC